MFEINIASLQIQIDNRFDEISRLCRSYRVDNGHPDFAVSASDTALEHERHAAGEGFSDGYLETLAVYRAVGEQLPHYDAFIFHSAVIEVDGLAYAFTARSGTGKSTHIRHWKNAFGERVNIVNGDKPIFRFIDGKPHACGTPWAGKEGWQRNVCVPLAGICFLERGETDRITPLEAKGALTKALSQIYLPTERSAAERTLVLLDRALREIPLWQLQCTDSVHAAYVAADAILKTEKCERMRSV